MYPTISDLLQDLFHVHLPLPIQTFGFFVGVAFLISAWILGLEIKRKEQQGLMLPRKQKVWVGKPASFSELIISALTGFIIGFKLLYAVTHYAEFAGNPQEVILSGKGSGPGGILTGALMAYLKYREKQKNKLEQPREETVTIYPHDELGNMVIICIVGGLLGAKIFHNLENIDEFTNDPVGALLSFSGLTMYGGLIVVTLSLYFFSKKIGVKFIHIADAGSPAVLLGYAIGRIGCHMSGDGDWGIVNKAPQPDWMSFLPEWFWKYNYPHNVISEGVPIPGCSGRHCMMLPEAVFPTPLYEAIVCIILFAILWQLRKKLHRPGQIFSLYLLMNGVERLSIEQIRVNTEYHVNGYSFTQAELIATLLILSGGYLMYIFSRPKPATP